MIGYWISGATNMHMWRHGLIALSALMALCLSPATAVADDFDTCEKESGDVAIAACTRGIASGKYKGDKLAVLYNDRGVEYANKGDRDRSIADLDQAIKLKPDYPEAYSNRGDAWRIKGDLVRAMADLDKSIELNPKSASPYYNRGLTWEAQKDWQNALTDFKKFSELAPKDPDGPKAVARVTKAMGGK